MDGQESKCHMQRINLCCVAALSATITITETTTIKTDNIANEQSEHGTRSNAESQNTNATNHSTLRLYRYISIYIHTYVCRFICISYFVYKSAWALPGRTGSVFYVWQLQFMEIAFNLFSVSGRCLNFTLISQAYGYRGEHTNIYKPCIIYRQCSDSLYTCVCYCA